MEDAPGYFASCTAKEILEDSSFTLMEDKLEKRCKDNCTQPPQASLIYCNRYTYTCVLIV